METLVNRVVGWSDRRVLVTGATGVVGSWLTRRLVDLGTTVVVLVRDLDPQSELSRSRTIDRTHVVCGELENYAAIERALVVHEVDTVFHLGAQTLVGAALRAPLHTFESNIRGSYNLLEACRAHGDLIQRVVVASSDKAYGDVDVLPYLEEMPMAGRHPYDVSKSCTDLIARCYAETYGLPVGIARCGNVHGGGDFNWSRIVPGTLRALLSDRRPQLRSDGQSTRDYIFVDDVVDAYLLLADALNREEVRGEAFNFSSGRPLTVLEVVEHLGRCVGSSLEPQVVGTATAEIRHQHLDSGKASRVLGWSPSLSVEDGFQRTTTWYSDYFSA